MYVNLWFFTIEYFYWQKIIAIAVWNSRIIRIFNQCAI
jgi:hypothetical protein